VRRTSLLVLVALASLCIAGCPSIWSRSAVKTDEGQKSLYKSAEENFQKKKYGQAIELYERLKSAYPDFDKIPLVYERIADSHFNLSDYDEAVGAYRQFLELYPNHEDRARAKYMIGMAYFKQIIGTDRDNTMVKSAEVDFKTVIDDPNAGQWKAKAEEKYRECRKKLGEKELYKARTYVAIKKYKAAKIAAQRVLDEYPNLGLDKEAKVLIKNLKGR